ncbi:MAG: hypothetical protein IH962_04500 [Chloroflexi bacterium]|nr:hypothetical protein [Chloroflexota bacterium]
MVTITKPSQPETIKVSVEPEMAGATAIAVEELEKLMVEPVTAENGSLLSKMVHGLEAVYDWVSGPPTTERDRLRRAIAEAHPGSQNPV